MTFDFWELIPRPVRWLAARWDYWIFCDGKMAALQKKRLLGPCGQEGDPRKVQKLGHQLIFFHTTMNDISISVFAVRKFKWKRTNMNRSAEAWNFACQRSQQNELVDIAFVTQLNPVMK